MTDRYRRVLGGLDRAVEQAEAKHLHDMFIVDIDCHMYEPFSSFSDYLPERWRRDYSRARTLDDEERYKEDYMIFAGGNPNELMDPLKLKLLEVYHETEQFSPQKRFDFQQGGRIRRSEVNVKRLEGMKPEQTVDIFVNRMQDIGVKRTIIFPHLLLNIHNHPNADFEDAMANAFIDFMLDKFLGKYPEILSCIMLPANSPDKAAELMDRVGSEKGIVGGMITAHRPKFAGDDTWLPIYEAARRKNLPICFHASQSYVPPYDQFNSLFPFHALSFPFNLILQMTSLVTSGVPERFPDLKFVFIEGGLTWIPWIMNRLDSVYMMMRSEAPILKRLPSEYIKQFYFSSQPLEHTPTKGELEYTFKKFNADTQLMYASDYPHHDFDVPSVIYDLPFLTSEAKKNILGENARKLFRIN